MKAYNLLLLAAFCASVHRIIPTRRTVFAYDYKCDTDFIIDTIVIISRIFFFIITKT